MCYVPREGDIIIDTSYKSGTTWTQTICAMLLNKGNVPGWDDEDFPGVMELSPWVDMRIPPPAVTQQVLNAQTERRFLKSHLPLDGLPFYPQVKYVLLVRDLRDVAYSWYNHWYCMRDFSEHVFNKVQGLVGPPLPDPVGEGWTAHKTFLDMAYSECEGSKLWSYWHHLATWMQYRHLPNVHIIHYANMKKDPKGEISKLAEYLDIAISDEDLDVVVHKTSIGYMKEHNEKILGKGFGGMFEGGGNSFINKGMNNRWADEITAEENAAYEQYGKQRLGDDVMHWVMTGEGLL